MFNQIHGNAVQALRSGAALVCASASGLWCMSSSFAVAHSQPEYVINGKSRAHRVD